MVDKFSSAITIYQYLGYYAGNGYHDKSEGTFQRNRLRGAVNRLQSPSHFLQKFPRHQGHTLLPVRVILGSSSARYTTSTTTVRGGPLGVMEESDRYTVRFGYQKAKERPDSFLPSLLLIGLDLK